MNFDLSIIRPEITMSCGALLILMLDVFFAKKIKEFVYISHFLALIVTAITAYFVINNFAKSELIFNQEFLSNSFTSLSKSLMLMLLMLTILMSLGFIFSIKKTSAEFLSLLMLSAVGGMVLVSANDFLVFYLGLELQALALYLLAAMNRHSKKSSEAGMKYFILGSTASGILLFGVTMIYAFSGTVNFSALNTLYNNGSDISAIPVAVIFGYVLVIVAMFFKVSAAPFHMWAPDVYEGATTIVVTFFATVVKFISVLVLVRLCYSLMLHWLGIGKIFVGVGVLSIAVGSFGAIFQKNLKRLLAYSSIGHIGFMLLAMSLFNNVGFAAAIFYMIVYSIISVGSFGFLNLIKNYDGEEESDEKNNKIFDMSALSGLSKRNPIMAFSLAVLMFSSAGIPPLAGFFSKFYILVALVAHGNFILAVAVVLLSVVSAFYYLRIVKVMYFDAPKHHEVMKLEDVGNVKFIVFVAALINILLIIYANDLLLFITNFLF